MSRDRVTNKVKELKDTQWGVGPYEEGYRNGLDRVLDLMGDYCKCEKEEERASD